MAFVLGYQHNGVFISNFFGDQEIPEGLLQSMEEIGNVGLSDEVWKVLISLIFKVSHIRHLNSSEVEALVRHWAALKVRTREQAIELARGILMQEFIPRH